MKRCLVLAALATLPMLAVPDVCVAQGRPAVTVAGGYAALKDADMDDWFGKGWVGSIGGALTPSIELVGEVGGHYKTTEAPEFGIKVGIDMHTFMGGVRYVGAPGGKVSAFVQGLAGVVRVSGGLESCGSLLPASACSEAMSADLSRTFFSIQPGAGIDIAMGRRVGVRLQGDYRVVFPRDVGEDADPLHEFRFSAGLVFGFGTK